DGLEGDVAPGTPTQPFSVGESQRGDLTLVVGAGVADVQGRTVGIAAPQATSSDLKRLNDLFEKGDMEQLRKEADAVLAKDPKLGGALSLRGVAMWKLGRAAEAADTMRQAIAVIPDQTGIQ